MRSDSRALLGDWLFCDLNQDLLTFTQQIGDRRLMSLATRLSAISTLFALATLITCSLVRASVT